MNRRGGRGWWGGIKAPWVGNQKYASSPPVIATAHKAIDYHVLVLKVYILHLKVVTNNVFWFLGKVKSFEQRDYRTRVMKAVLEKPQLKTIGLIPDGNRRYAKKMGLGYYEAYQLGYDKILEFMDFCSEKKIKNIIVYALSADNFLRSNIAELLKFEEEKLIQAMNDERIHRNKIRLEVVTTEEDKMPNSMRDTMKAVYDATKDYGKHCLKLLIGYSAQKELIRLLAKGLPQSTKDLISNLMVNEEVDLVVRSGNVQRLSDFLPLQTRYSELYFIEKLWPEVTQQDFEGAVNFYYSQKRNFGT